MLNFLTCIWYVTPIIKRTVSSLNYWGGGGGGIVKHSSWHDTWDQKASIMWKRPSFPPAKNCEAMPSVGKILQLSFCTIKLSLWILLIVVTLTADRYCGTPRDYGRPFVAKVSGSLCQGVIILHNNARLHIANLTCKALCLCSYGPTSLLFQSHA